MAGIGKRSNGCYFVRFVDEAGQRRTVAIGTKSEKLAQAARIKIEAIIATRRLAQPIDPETALWVSNLSSKMRERLENIGLLSSAPENKPKIVTLGEMLDAYFDRRTDVKPGTTTNWSHTRRNLLEHFGRDKRLTDLTVADAKDFERFLKTSAREGRYVEAEVSDGLSDNTTRKRISNAKQFFNDAVERRIIDHNPFAGLKSSTRGNRSRFYFVTPDEAAKVIDACPDAEWRLIFALSRFGGFRCPSEHLQLRWSDVDWVKKRITVHSPKTEHHPDGESREIPIFPELRPYLEECFEPGEEFVITRYRRANSNLRTQFKKIIRRAGLEPWPKLFQNLRSTRHTELEESFPSHVVCQWIGNSKAVAAEHYLQVTNEHFAKAVANDGALHLRSSKTPHGVASGHQNTTENAQNRTFSHGEVGKVGGIGFEPTTPCVSSKCSNQLS